MCLGKSTKALKKELDEAKLAAEEARRGWREEYDARIEAEEAKAAVIKSADAAMEEVNELKKKLQKETEEAILRTQYALRARKAYEEAKDQTEEVKKIWRAACRSRISTRSSERLAIEAREKEEREEYILKQLD